MLANLHSTSIELRDRRWWRNPIRKENHRKKFKNIHKENVNINHNGQIKLAWTLCALKRMNKYARCEITFETTNQITHRSSPPERKKNTKKYSTSLISAEILIGGAFDRRSCDSIEADSWSQNLCSLHLKDSKMALLHFVSVTKSTKFHLMISFWHSYSMYDASN